MESTLIIVDAATSAENVTDRNGDVTLVAACAEGPADAIGKHASPMQYSSLLDKTVNNDDTFVINELTSAPLAAGTPQ
jgi:hypothetical protein